MLNMLNQKTALIVFSLSFVYLIVGIAFNQFPTDYFGDDYFYIRWGSIGLLHWMNLFIVIALLKKKGLQLRDIGFSFSKKALIYLGAYLCLTIILALIEPNTEQKLRTQKYPLLPHDTIQNFYWILMCFTAGFCEEIIWRGYTIRMMINENHNKYTAVVIGSLLFVLMHGYSALTTPFYALFLLLFGILYGLVFLYTKKLELLMFIHMLYDFLFIFYAVHH
jgi:membrane protease YdiL (CAAX protease family)